MATAGYPPVNLLSNSNANQPFQPVAGNLLRDGPLQPAYIDSLGAVVSGDGKILNSTVAQMGRSGRTWGAASGKYVLGSVTIPAGAIAPGALLRLRGLYAKFSPYNAGGVLEVHLIQGAGTALLVQTAIGATLGSMPFAADIQLSYDRKWGFPSGTNNVNLFGQASMTAGTYSVQTAIANSAPVSNSPRAQGTIAFATYSASPTIETLKIDFDQPSTLQVSIGIGANDSAELLYCVLDAIVSSSHGRSPTTVSTLFAGDSLTEGAGSTANNDLASRFGKTFPGRSVLNFGLGGQNCAQIADRVVADPVAGKYWDLVFWGGANDASADPTAWFALIKAAVTRIQAHRAGAGARMLILNLHPSSAWSAGIKSALEIVNASLLAEYGPIVVDVYAALGTTGGVVPGANLSDAIHLSDAGYGLVNDACVAKKTALGWP